MPAVLVTGAVEADGRDERSYDCTTGMTPRERAWEFLRRNPAFQREVTAASQQANSWSYQPLLDLVASAGDLLRWGVLCFAESYGRNSIVSGSALVRPCVASHCRTSASIVGDNAVRTLGIAMSCDGPAWRPAKANMFFFAMPSIRSSSPSLAWIS
ncbi:MULTISPECIES: DUF6499 domain-containing protein [unclassified Mesorhizobium]|uniref:transcriptional regulator domain-containing protein n=1 Tax=unclassified Mesorhizobium TaxID=325217 RepID=UPI001FE17B17|nr:MULTISPECIES: DUF6499 domain-containing protein [unclassified Mesorhizobium]MCT2581013.1 hypothetical protein [Mesorhizobium sp. P13.3]MDF3169780.1 hypothetical protein [Mesorhizobium sp. P16.1]MDF3180553.1 hypothetical protein [Mesorhizobium sp. P17.1]MDF3186693.1 hypothetical protein [Mesorhizobium sp. ICCV3110.1]